jgi:hypothetical protein
MSGYGSNNKYSFLGGRHPVNPRPHLPPILIKEECNLVNITNSTGFMPRPLDVIEKLKRFNVFLSSSILAIEKKK